MVPSFMMPGKVEKENPSSGRSSIYVIAGNSRNPVTRGIVLGPPCSIRAPLKRPTTKIPSCNLPSCDWASSACIFKCLVKRVNHLIKNTKSDHLWASSHHSLQDTTNILVSQVPSHASRVTPAQNRAAHLPTNGGHQCMLLAWREDLSLVEFRKLSEVVIYPWKYLVSCLPLALCVDSPARTTRPPCAHATKASMPRPGSEFLNTTPF